jgi:hypothetical protein
MTYIPPFPNGPAAPTASTPVTTPGTYFSPTTITAPASGYEYLTASSGGWYDALGHTWISFTFVTNSAVTAGTVQFECTNDLTNASSGITWFAQDNSTTNPSRVSSLGFTASTSKQFEAPITARYIRLRMSTAVSAGSIIWSATMLQTAPKISSLPITPTSGLLGAGVTGYITPLASNNSLGFTNIGSTTTTDITTGAITSTASSGLIYVGNTPAGASFNITVTAVSGTSPAMDVVIQESIDGTNFTDLYHFERITSAGSYTSPALRLSLIYVRYVRTISGSLPSFTMYLQRLHKSGNGQFFRSYFDRTISPNTVGSMTPTYYCHGAIGYKLVTSISSGTSGGQLTLQGSDDNINWWQLGVMATNATGTATISIVNTHAKWMRLITTTAATAQVLNYVQISVIGP